MTSMRRLAEGTPDDDEESYYTDEESSYTYEDVELTLARVIFVSLGYSNVGAAIDHCFSTTTSTTSLATPMSNMISRHSEP